MKTSLRKTLTKLSGLFLGLAMILGVGAAGYAGNASETRAGTDTYYMTPNNATTGNNATAYVTTAYSFTYNEIGWTINQWNPKTLQIKTNQSSAGSEFYFNNTTAFPGKITKVVITFSALTISNANGLCFLGGTSTQTGTSGGTAGKWDSTAKTLTWEPASSTNYTYFKFYQNGKVASGTNNLASSNAIAVTYSAGPTKLTAPTNLSGSQVSGTSDANLTWSAVTGASSYQVKVDNRDTYTGITTNSTTVQNLSAGNHSFTVQAIGDGTNYDTSEESSSSSFTITAPKELDHVTLGGNLSKTSYTYGDSWSSSGLTLTAYYTDTTSATVTGSYSFDPTTPKVGTTSVSITGSYGGKSDTKSYTVSVSKTQLSAPSPEFSAANKQITWENVPNASSYQVKIGSGTYTTATSPYAVSSYEGDGAKDFYIKAIGNSNYSDSAEAHITFEVKATVLYELVTSTDNLVAGANYIIGNGSSGDVRFMSTDENANNRKQTNSFTVNSGKVEYDNSMLKLELGGKTDAWTFLTKNYCGTNGYLKSADSGSNNHCLVTNQLKTATISFSNNAAIITLQPHTSRNIVRYNSSSSCFACYSSGQSAVYLYKEINTTPTFAISPAEINMHLYGESVDAEFVTANISSPNFTIVSNSDSSVATGTINENLITISSHSEGETTISVKETTKNITASINIKVDRIPYYATLADVELESHGSSTSKYKNLSTLLKIYDAGGTSSSNEIPLSNCEIEWLPANSDNVKFTDGRIYGNEPSDEPIEITATIKVPDGEPIIKTSNVTVIDDYPHPGTWNITGEPTKKEYEAGESFNPEGIIAKYKTHFHHGTNDEQKELEDLSTLLYTTSSDGDGKVSKFYFSASDVGENMTVYIYSENEKIGYVSGIKVNAKEVPLTNISFLEGEKGTIKRGDSMRLTPVFTEGTTDARTINWTIKETTNDVTVTNDNGLGLITVSNTATVNETYTIVATSTVKTDVKAEFVITIDLETQTIDTKKNLPESWEKVDDSSSLKPGDTVILTGVKNGFVYAAGTLGLDSTATNVQAITDQLTVSSNKITSKVSNDMKYTLEAGTVEGSVAFKDSNNRYLYAAASSGNQLKAQDSIDENASFTLETNGNVIATNSSNRNRMRYNNTGTSNLFNCYANDNTGTVITFYKKVGGSIEGSREISLDLYTAVKKAESCFACSFSNGLSFVTGKTWDDVCGAFSELNEADTYILTYGIGVEEFDKFGAPTNKGNEVEHFLSRYDYIVSVYEEYDSLNRFTKDTTGNKPGAGVDYKQRSPKLNNLFGENSLLGEATPATWIITIIALAGIAATGGYFFIRKRKED